MHQSGVHACSRQAVAFLELVAITPSVRALVRRIPQQTGIVIRVFVAMPSAWETLATTIFHAGRVWLHLLRGMHPALQALKHSGGACGRA
jgi:hypothetical protein